MNFTKVFKAGLLAVVLNLLLPTAVFAQELEVQAPTGFSAILTLIPLIIVLVLLFSWGNLSSYHWRDWFSGCKPADT
jgi:hypothetical protein